MFPVLRAFKTVFRSVLPPLGLERERDRERERSLEMLAQEFVKL
jgi:hypothetical protein